MDDEFYLDSLTYEINLNGKSLKIPISRANYKRLRPIVENFYFSLFKNKPDNLTNSHILVEFDPLKYNKLLSSFSNDSNYVIYNRRRPYIWNYSTFSILNKGFIYHHIPYIIQNVRGSMTVLLALNIDDPADPEPPTINRLSFIKQ